MNQITNFDPTRHNYLFEQASRKEIKEAMAHRSRAVINRKMLLSDQQEYRYRIVKS